MYKVESNASQGSARDSDIHENGDLVESESIQL